ncbi:LSU ribosomal protein L24P [Pedococcus dokdonensis]|uniref:Large ribosomal subunit protein uL24 n=1 Tax=Pedococcus dokdonensis TaxID=443156 RepID=A0A1H0VA08_9MICO|nr:LSU ribosomal protein L24P [Pedococcus dokdonensis]
MADKKKMKIKKGDTVKVLTGKDRNSIGKVIAVYPETERVLVEGVNRVTRHTKAGQSARGTRTGGLVVQEAAIHVSNVAVVDPDDKKVGTRIKTASRPSSATAAPRPFAPVSRCARARTCERDHDPD